jgi:hypothetical protein
MVSQMTNVVVQGASDNASDDHKYSTGGSNPSSR